MVSYLHLFFWVATGCLSALFAKRRGKNPYLWFGIGAVLGILGLFLILFMPKKRAQKKKEEGVTIDVTPLHKENFWYYLTENNEQMGPMSFDSLNRAFVEGTVTKNTYVWNEALEDWKHLSEFLTS